MAIACSCEETANLVELCVGEAGGNLLHLYYRRVGHSGPPGVGRLLLLRVTRKVADLVVALARPHAPSAAFGSEGRSS